MKDSSWIIKKSAQITLHLPITTNKLSMTTKIHPIQESIMFKIKKIDNEDRVKHMELKENRTEDVGVKDASITLKSAFKLKGGKTGDGGDGSEN